MMKNWYEKDPSVLDFEIQCLKKFQEEYNNPLFTYAHRIRQPPALSSDDPRCDGKFEVIVQIPFHPYPETPRELWKFQMLYSNNFPSYQEGEEAIKVYPVERLIESAPGSYINGEIHTPHMAYDKATSRRFLSLATSSYSPEEVNSYNILYSVLRWLLFNFADLDSEESSGDDTMKKDLYSTDCNVYFTNRAYLELVMEVSRYPGIETGGVFIGRRLGNDFYVFESVDAGKDAVRTRDYLKQDFAYVGHLGDVYQDLYEDAYVIGSWHRHPGGYDVFSPADWISNADYAKRCNGAICGLVNINPDFRLQLFYVSHPDGEPTLCNPAVIDDSVFEGIMVVKDYRHVIASINQREQLIPLSFYDNHSEESTSIRHSVQKKTGSFAKKMVDFFSPKRTVQNSSDIDASPSRRLFSEIQDDLECISRYAIVKLDDKGETSIMSVVIKGVLVNTLFIFSWDADNNLSISYMDNDSENTVSYTRGLLPALLDEMSSKKEIVNLEALVEEHSNEDCHVRK